MASARIRVRFASTLDTTARDSFTEVIGLFGSTYEANQGVLIVLADPDRREDLQVQLNAWQEQGALTWSDSG